MFSCLDLKKLHISIKKIEALPICKLFKNGHKRERRLGMISMFVGYEYEYGKLRWYVSSMSNSTEMLFI